MNDINDCLCFSKLQFVQLYLFTLGSSIFFLLLLPFFSFLHFLLIDTSFTTSFCLFFFDFWLYLLALFIILHLSTISVELLISNPTAKQTLIQTKNINLTNGNKYMHYCYKTQYLFSNCNSDRTQFMKSHELLNFGCLTYVFEKERRKTPFILANCH